MVGTLQERIDEAARKLARHSARASSLEQTLKQALLDKATSPTALVAAFGTGAVLGRRSGPIPSNDEAENSESQTDETKWHSPFERLLDDASTAVKWLALVPVIAGLWQQIAGDPAIKGDLREDRET